MDVHEAERKERVIVMGCWDVVLDKILLIYGYYTWIC